MRKYYFHFSRVIKTFGGIIIFPKEILMYLKSKGFYLYNTKLSKGELMFIFTDRRSTGGYVFIDRDEIERIRKSLACLSSFIVYSIMHF